jgi:hypothetical protein
MDEWISVIYGSFVELNARWNAFVGLEEVGQEVVACF